MFTAQVMLLRNRILEVRLCILCICRYDVNNSAYVPGRVFTILYTR